MSDTPEHDFDCEFRFKTSWIRSPEKEPTAAEMIEDALVEGGLPPAAVPACVARIEEIANDLAMTHAAEFIAHVLKSLDGTSAGISLQRAILGSGGESIRDAADRAGVSSTAVFKQEQKIRARLRGGLTAAPKVLIGA